ncbi:MAG: CHAT domain-containing tetratricopeptide repeat protein [Thermotogota bacterium]|nr:CHAT domain-containing tetratricopeptide repeat protein [Thermotogota bacterium]
MENVHVGKIIKKMKEFAKNKDLNGFKEFTKRVIQENLLNKQLNYSSKRAIIKAINEINLFFADFNKNEEFLLHLLDQERKRQNGKQDYIAFLINLVGELYYFMGQYNFALENYKKALDIRYQLYGDSHPDTIECYSNLALLYTELGRLREAEELFILTLKAYESKISGHIQEYITTIWNAGLMYQYWGKYSLAMEKYLTAMEISQLNVTKELTDSIENNLGVLYLETGNYQAAEQYLQKSSEFTLQYYGINHPKTIITLNNLVSAQMNLEKLDKAEKGFLQLQQTEKSSMPIISLKIKINYAVYIIKTGKTQEALALLKGCLEKNTTPETRIKIFSHIAKIQVIHKNVEKAFETIKKAIFYQKEVIGRRHIQYTKLLGLLGLILIHQNKKDEAFKTLSESTQLQNEILLQVSTSFSKDYAWNFLQKIKGELNELLSLFYILQKESTPKKLVKCKYIQEIYEILLKRKAVVFDAGAERYHQILKKRDPDLKRLFEKLVKIKEEIVLRTTKGYFSDSPEENQKRLNKLTSEAEILENRISIVVPIYSHELKTKQATLQQLKNKIPEKTLFVDIYKFHFFDFFTQEKTPQKEGYIIFYLQKSKTEFLFIENAAEIEKLIKKTESANDNPNRGVIKNSYNEAHDLTPENALGKLWHVLFGTQDIINNSNFDSICFSPDGEFFNLPFEALICKNGEYLIENYRVQYINSGRQLIYEQSNQNNKDTVMIFANPLFEIKKNLKTSVKNNKDRIKQTLFRNELNLFPQLPGTASEAEKIVKVLKKHHINSTSVYTHESVNDSELKKIDSPKILHFATHGFYLENRVDIHPFSRCGIALSGINNILKGELIPFFFEDGMLTGMDILSLNLINTDIVVLSACKTGRGQMASGEGVMGLCSALIASGVSSVMVSIWNVPDIFTVRLMSSFYENLVAGMKKSEALKRSKQKLILSLRTQWGEAPSWIWGGFILYGDDSAIRNLSMPSNIDTVVHGEKN